MPKSFLIQNNYKVGLKEVLMRKILISFLVLATLSSLSMSKGYADVQETENQRQALKNFFSFKNLMKLFFSNDQERLVAEYLDNFSNTPEEKIRDNLNKLLKTSPVGNFIKPDSNTVYFYARMHKDPEILEGLAGGFKDRSNFYSFLGVSAFLFFLGIMRKRYKRKNKGVPGTFIKSTAMLLVLLFMQYSVFMFFFGENLQPAIQAFDEIERERAESMEI